MSGVAKHYVQAKLHFHDGSSAHSKDFQRRLCNLSVRKALVQKDLLQLTCAAATDSSTELDALQESCQTRLEPLLLAILRRKMFTQISDSECCIKVQDLTLLHVSETVTLILVFELLLLCLGIQAIYLSAAYRLIYAQQEGWCFCLDSLSNQNYL